MYKEKIKIRTLVAEENKGGNAVNLAYSLAKLGRNITLFTVADGVGSAILCSVFSKLKDKTRGTRSRYCI